MFLTPRLLRYVRHHPSSTGAPPAFHTHLKPLLAGRCQRPLLLLFHPSSIPTILGLYHRRDHHGSGDRRPPSSAEKGGKKSGGQRGGKEGDVGGTSGSGSGKKDSGTNGYQTVSPTAIQVYSDPTLARTVRELSVVLQRVRNNLKNTKEEMEDCTFEIIKQSQNQRTFDKMAKEAKALSSDALEKLTSQKQELSVMEKNLVFFSKMAACHDNQIRDSILRLNEFDRRLEIVVSKLDYIGSSLTRVKSLVNDDMKSEIRELRLAIQLGKNERRHIREALLREGIAVNSSSSLVSKGDIESSSRRE